MQASLMMSRGFLKSSNSQKRLFEYLLKETLEKRGNALMQKTISQKVLGTKSTNHETAVRVLAGRLRKSLQGYYAGAGMDDPLVISMPTGRYTLEFLEHSAYLKSLHLPRHLAEKPSVAIMEFRGIGLNSPWTIFPSVLAEELTVVLGGIADLLIIGPLYRSELTPDLSDVNLLSRHYAATFIIDGSITCSGGSHILRIRIIDGRTSVQFWSKRYEWGNGAQDIDALAIDLMNGLAHELGAPLGILNSRLSEIARIKAKASSVFEAILLARHYFKEFTWESYLRGVKSLREAIKIAPTEALPRATLSLLHVGAWNEKFSSDLKPPVEIDLEARRSSLLDPASEWSKLALLCASVVHRRNEEISRIASEIAGDPSATKMALGTVGLWLIYQKIDPPLGRLLISRAMENNPHYPRYWHLPLAIDSLAMDDNEGALQESEKFIPQPYWAVHMVQAVVAARRGENRKARAKWEGLLRLFPDFPVRGYHVCGRSWHHDHALMIATSLREGGFPVELPQKSEQSSPDRHSKKQQSSKTKR